MSQARLWSVAGVASLALASAMSQGCGGGSPASSTAEGAGGTVTTSASHGSTGVGGDGTGGVGSTTSGTATGAGSTGGAGGGAGGAATGGAGGSASCTPGATMPCYSGAAATKDVGACHGGTATCDGGGTWAACAGEITPTAETCNGVDDDCNGAVDDGIAPVTCGVGACQVTVDPSCVAGDEVACVPLVPAPKELCNGIDDNCDGQIDEGCACQGGATQPCYTGPMATRHVGVCADGVQSCENDVWGTCTGQILPSAETCDGLDDDCNGVVDDNNPGGGGMCSTGKLGSCGVGAWSCSGGALTCVQIAQPSPEVCDGKDNDCDGAVDNGNPGGGAACNTGLPGACAAGTTACINGLIFCKANAASPEVCDGKDNDCNGVVDDGNPGGGFACSTGLFGACSLGTATCTNGAVLCVQNVQASPEVCDGKDNDCDGLVDNGNPGGGLGCDTGKHGVCAEGTTACANGMEACNQNVQPSPEVCDGKDNNCDGNVDEGNPGGGAVCNTGKPGVCTAGTITCVNGALGCVENVQASPEVCDGKDNDCDGAIDDGNPGGGVGCNTGKPGVCSIGTTFCGAGSLHCVQNVQPAGEICDGLDNDCNGTADDGNPGGGAACNTGKLGVCAAGTVTCVNGALTCVQNVQASIETCDGLDNDCDGQIDEGSPGTGVACDTGKLGVCQLGTTKCSSGVLHCNQNVQAGPEACDGLDNDCDGQVDDGNPGGGAACNTGNLGVCAAGTVTCAGGALACKQNLQASAEVCDGLDNNCDGVVDEGNPGVGASCNTGKPGVCAPGTVTACSNGGPVCTQKVLPSGEICDGKDNDCNGQIDEGNVCGCAHGRCEAGVTLAPGCDAPAGFPSCVAQVCAADSFCCASAWDALCVGEVGSVCGLSPCY